MALGKAIFLAVATVVSVASPCCAQPLPTISVATYSSTKLSWEPPTNSALGVLQQISTAGAVLYPVSAGYDEARKPWQTFFQCNAYPSIVVQPATANDVVLALTYAKNNSMHVTVRNGGHSYAGLSRSYGMVLDVRRLKATNEPLKLADGTFSVKMGAGRMNIEAYYQLAQYGLVLPAGGCPSVGISGLTLGGGFGVFSRKLGLTAHQVIALEAVVYNSASSSYEKVAVTHDQYSDLFYAFRGGMGGNYGVVTSWTYRASPIRTVHNKVFKLNLATSRAKGNWSDVIDAITAFMVWCDNTTNDTYCEMSLSTGNIKSVDVPQPTAITDQLPASFDMEFICMCDASDVVSLPACQTCEIEARKIDSALDAINARSGNYSLFSTPEPAKPINWTEFMWSVAGPECEKMYDDAKKANMTANGVPINSSIVSDCAKVAQSKVGRGQHNRKKSLFMSRNPDYDTLDTLLRWFDDFARNILVDTFTAANVEFYYWGGALADQPRYPSPWTHQDQKWLVHVTGRFPDTTSPLVVAQVYQAVNDLHRRLAAPFQNGLEDYQNFADAALSYEAWSNFYYNKDTIMKLTAINQKYNPNDIFRSELSIPVVAAPLTCTTTSSCTRLTPVIGFIVLSVIAVMTSSY